MNLGMRQTVEYIASTSETPYTDHLEEAFTACIIFIRTQYPDAELRLRGYDMGGPLWEVLPNDH